MEKQIIKVEGMSCSHCEHAVKTAVGALDGVSSVLVDLAGKTAAVEFEASKVKLQEIINVIEEQGYDVVL